MNYQRRGLKALGLSLLAALGLMAFTAAAAQANGTWLINSATYTESLSKHETITGKQEGTKNLLLILNLNLILECQVVEVKNATILPNGTGSGELHFLTCHALAGEEAACKFIEPIVAKVKALATLHNGAPAVLFTPLDLLTFATVKVNVIATPECPLPESATVKGSVLALVKENNKVELLISTKEALKLLGHTLKYGANEAHLSADALVSLTSLTHKGKTLGVH